MSSTNKQMALLQSSARHPAMDGMTSYGRLAADLWSRIARGEWATGGRLPTVVQLAKEYEVAVVTVRGALGLLSAQGIIHSQQGRGTFVRERPGNRDVLDGGGLGASYFDAWIAGPSEAVKVISRTDRALLPATLAGGAPHGDEYVHLRRLHLAGNRPVCLVDFYIAPEPYASLPAGIDEGFKIGLLLMTRAVPRPVQGRQVVTVSLSAPDDAELLKIAVGMPTVIVERRFLDEHGGVLGAGLHRYPGSVFRQVIDQPVSQILSDIQGWLPSVPAAAEPPARAPVFPDRSVKP